MSGEMRGTVSVQGLNREKGIPENKCVHGACEHVCTEPVGGVRKRVSQVCLQQGPRDFQE